MSWYFNTCLSEPKLIWHIPFPLLILPLDLCRGISSGLILVSKGKIVVWDCKAFHKFKWQYWKWTLCIHSGGRSQSSSQLDVPWLELYFFTNFLWCDFTLYCVCICLMRVMISPYTWLSHSAAAQVNRGKVFSLILGCELTYQCCAYYFSDFALPVGECSPGFIYHYNHSEINLLGSCVFISKGSEENKTMAGGHFQWCDRSASHSYCAHWSHSVCHQHDATGDQKLCTAKIIKVKK